MMRLGYNLLWLRPGQVGGSEHAAVDALRAVAAIKPIDTDVFLFVTRAFATEYQSNFAEGTKDPLAACQLVVDELEIGAFERVRRILREATWLPRQIRKHNIDVMHHLGGTIPVRAPKNVEHHLTIHDLQPLDLPQNFSLPKRAFVQFMTQRSVKIAASISAPSAFVAEQINTRYPEAKVAATCVYWGSPTPDELSGPITEVTALIGKRFAYFPAANWRHKNHEQLIASWPDVAGLDLVLTGGRDAGGPNIEALIQASSAKARIHDLRRTGRDIVRWLYMNADMMVFPTGYEGFGLPVAEAASFGVAPLASDISMLDELLPHGVNRLPLDAPDAWAAIINEFAADSQARQNAVDAVRAHISAMTWEATARAWLDLYRS